MINFKNNLNNILLIFIFFVLLSLKNTIGLANQKSKLEKLSTSCELQENKIICFNFKINNKFKVSLLDEPYRIVLDFEKKIIFNYKKNKRNKFIENVRIDQKRGSLPRLVLELKKPVVISEIIYEDIRKDGFINLEILLVNTTITNFFIVKHILKKNSGNIL